MWKILAAASTALVLTGAPALAQMGWDTNQDAVVDYNEFGTGFGEGGVFNTWDVNQNAELDRDEWGTGMFGMFDRDDDGLWSDEEFGVYGERNFGGYGAWDEDESGFLSEDEFSRGVYGGYGWGDDDTWGDEEFGYYEDDDWF